MARDKRTVERQLAIIADFFKSDLSQAQILTKHRVSEETYRSWQFDAEFTDEIDRRITAAHRESAALIARVAGTAVSRLIELSKSPKEEIARRACLNIIALSAKAVENAPTSRMREPSEGPAITPEQASKLLAALADAAEETVAPAEPGAGL